MEMPDPGTRAGPRQAGGLPGAGTGGTAGLDAGRSEARRGETRRGAERGASSGDALCSISALTGSTGRRAGVEAAAARSVELLRETRLAAWKLCRRRRKGRRRGPAAETSASGRGVTLVTAPTLGAAPQTPHS